ncbi:MAG: dienelactone hydrolase family protein [Pseudomonadales bacterium]|nr:dienelactone hydrolase family protein [Pseudomonadales bacterium]
MSAQPSTIEREVEEIKFPIPGGLEMTGWICRPDASSKPAPAVLVVHEILGLIDNLKPILRRFADNGYVALCPQLFDKPGFKAICVAKTVYSMMSAQGSSVDDMQAAIDYLKVQDNVDENKLGVAGFCFGGGFALVMGLSPDIKASAPYYGTCPTFLKKIEDSCPVIASYGGKDLSMLTQIKPLKRALENANIEHEVNVYPNAGHSYMVKQKEPSIGSKLLQMSPMRITYKHDEAEESWEKMLAFFTKHVCDNEAPLVAGSNEQTTEALT